MILLLDGRPVRGTYSCDPPDTARWWLAVGLCWPLTLLRLP